jgi:hypothetical protein
VRLSKTIADNVSAPHVSGVFGDCECDTCLKAKVRSGKYPTRRYSYPPESLEVIAADVHGPFPLEDIEDNRWNLKVFDVYSGFARIFILFMLDKASITVCGKIKEFITQMERRTGKAAKVIEIDRGTDLKVSARNTLMMLGLFIEKEMLMTKRILVKWKGCMVLSII